MKIAPPDKQKESTTREAIDLINIEYAKLLEHVYSDKRLPEHGTLSFTGSQIFKLQRPLFASPGIPIGILCYNQKRDKNYTIEAPDGGMTPAAHNDFMALVNEIFKDNPKVYADCAPIEWTPQDGETEVIGLRVIKVHQDLFNW